MRRIIVVSGEEESNKYFSSHAVKPEFKGVFGYCSLPVLPFLVGRRWDDVGLAFVSSLEPTAIRVTDGVITTDAMTGRVTVMVNEDFIIQSIEKECNVWLPDGVEHGHALCQLVDIE